MLLNKCDLPQCEVTMSEVKEWGDSEGIEVYETSARTGKNVSQAFTNICRALIEAEPQPLLGPDSEGIDAVLNRRGALSDTKKGGCC